MLSNITFWAKILGPNNFLVCMYVVIITHPDYITCNQSPVHSSHNRTAQFLADFHPVIVGKCSYSQLSGCVSVELQAKCIVYTVSIQNFWHVCVCV